MTAWSDPRLACAYADLEAISETLVNGSTEGGCLREALSLIELADTYVEQRLRDNANQVSA